MDLSSAAGAQTLKKVADANKITVSYRGSSVPFSYLIGSTKAVGFSVELSEAIIDDVRKKVGKAVVGDRLRVEPYACIVRRDDPEFKKLVDGTLSRLMKSGEFARLYSKWFMSPIPPKGVNLNLPMSEQLKANLKALSDAPAL